jgi:prophage antirepressor-like protein
MTLVKSPAGTVEVETVKMSGLFRLIFLSKAEGAVQVQDWIFQDFLPEMFVVKGTDDLTI